MDTHQILQAVKAEISRLQKVVDLLEGSTPSPKAAVASRKHKGHKWTAAQRRAMSDLQKARWAKKKKRQ